MNLTTGHNHVMLLGHINAGPWHNPAVESKAESCAFNLAIPEPSKSGETYRTFVRIETYGKAVPHALFLRQADVVLIEGKIAWSKAAGEGKAQLCVNSWRILKLVSDNPMTG
jgi:hypothetical protein